MKFIFSIIRIALFIRKACISGLVISLYKIYKKNVLIILSLFFAPFSTIRFLYKPSSLSNSIEKLGPVFIKFAQSIATRSDIVGEVILLELSKLQDKLDAFDSIIAKNIIVEELGRKIEELFLEFSEMPVAAASVAQIHKARLKDGSNVAVKILRPNIHEIYQKDIKILYDFAYVLKILPTRVSKLKLNEAVEIFEKTMKFELDLKNEAASSILLAKNLKDDSKIIIPKIYEEFSTSRIMVLEWIDGIKIGQLNQYKEIDKRELAKNLAISFFNQAFRDGFFHADLHQGNILITKENKLVFIDFGIMGFLSEKDRLGLAEILYCLIEKNYIRVSEIHKEIGFISNKVNDLEFAIACKNIIEPIISEPINKVSVAHLLDSLLKMINDFGMETQPQLILLQKSILMLEGVGKELIPDINMWELADPWVKKWASKNLGFDAKIIKFIKRFMYIVN